MEERYLSLSEATDALDISERTAYRWIKSGKLRAYKPGRDYRIPQSAIRDVVEKSEVHPKGESRSSLEPSLFSGLDGRRQSGYEALAAWDDYLGLTLTRWEKLRRQFQDLANRDPDEERDADDLRRALVDSHEFFKAVDRFYIVVGGFDVPRFDNAPDAESRELVYAIRERADRLGRITDLFLEYNEKVTTAIEASQSAWAQQEVEKFLESLTAEEARTANVR
jgi:excisionase family DNA binding protein